MLSCVQKDHPIENAMTVITSGRRALANVVKIVFECSSLPAISTDSDGLVPGSLLLSVLSPSDFVFRGRRHVKPTNSEEKNARYAVDDVGVQKCAGLLYCCSTNRD